MKVEQLAAEIMSRLRGNDLLVVGFDNEAQDAFEAQVLTPMLTRFGASLSGGWEDIASAPRDGTPLLLFARCKTATAPVVLVGWYLPDLGWIESSFTRPVGIVPTHWRALTAPPASAETV